MPKLPNSFCRGFVLLVFVLTAGCAANEPYHTKEGVDQNCADPHKEECYQSYYQEYPDFDLAFAEFTERGNAFNNQWIEKVLGKISRYENSPGVVIVVFIHGWTHNAAETDPNLIDFKRSLQAIKQESKIIGERRLVGLYIGWRGASLTLPVLDNLTFWERKAVAEEVGSGGVTKLLLELDQIDRHENKNVLVVVGHSFGGAIVISAVSEILAERAIESRPERASGATIGDAVIVLNPAIEANRVLNMVETALKQRYPANQPPLFISLSTDADWATHNSFPIGQSLGLWLTWHQIDIERSYYFDRLTGEPLVLKEEHLDATTVGNFAPYLTHWLTLQEDGETARLNFQTCHEVPEKCTPKGRTTLSGHPTFGPLPDNYPLYFIKTDATMMAGHNDIFNPVVRGFLLAVIDDIVRHALATEGHYLTDKRSAGSMPLLADPEELNRRFGRFYSNRPHGGD